jgi:AcrR family transcriptional regulator
MARKVKKEDYASRRKEILDVAQTLIYTRGYEQMSIQDILDALKISKGAFYHYFDSKQALLDGLVDRMLDQAEQVTRPIVDAPNLTAIEKMRRYLDTGGRWKLSQKAFMLNLLRVWRADSNALLRQKQEAAGIKRIAPMLTQIIRQGMDEGVFTTQYPDQFGAMIVGLSRGVEDAISELLLSEIPPPDALQRLVEIMGAYSESFERILGAPSGSLPLGDIKTMKAWLEEPVVAKT